MKSIPDPRSDAKRSARRRRPAVPDEELPPAAGQRRQVRLGTPGQRGVDCPEFFAQQTE